MSAKQRINRCALHVAIYAQNLIDRTTKGHTNAEPKKSVTTPNNAGYAAVVTERTILGQPTMSSPLTQKASYSQHTDPAIVVAEQNYREGHDDARR